MLSCAESLSVNGQEERVNFQMLLVNCNRKATKVAERQQMFVLFFQKIEIESSEH